MQCDRGVVNVILDKFKSGYGRFSENSHMICFETVTYRWKLSELIGNRLCE